MTLPPPSARGAPVTLVDTMLLAPAGHQSLGALGEMLGLPSSTFPPAPSHGCGVQHREAGAVPRVR